MFPLKSVWKSLVSHDQTKPPGRNEKSMVADSLMSELDYNIKELEKIFNQKELDKTRQKTGVDYSWLVTTTPKGYQIPQLERLELEELFYQVKPEECGKILTLFRDTLLNEPQPSQLPSLLKACVRQTIQQRPKDQSVTEWLTQRTMSIATLKGRHAAKVTPSTDERDPENNHDIQTEERIHDTPQFKHDIETLPV